MELLLKHGANVHAENDYALRQTSKYGYKNIVEILLKYGANVHANDDEALRNGHKDAVELLIKYSKK